MRLCHMRDGLNSDDEITIQTLVSLLSLLEGRMAFNNVFLRHYLFCILQILAKRPPILHGIPRESTMLHMSLTKASNYHRNLFVLDSESKPLELPSSTENLARDLDKTEVIRFDTTLSYYLLRLSLFELSYYFVIWLW